MQISDVSLNDIISNPDDKEGKHKDSAQEKMRTILSLLALFCLASAKSSNVTLLNYTITDDNSLLCGTDLNNTLVVFSVTNDLIIQNITTGASSSSISGDGQWIVVIQNETITFYIRQAQGWRVFLQFNRSAVVTCNVAGSTPVGVPMKSQNVYNNTRVQVVYHNSTGPSRVIDAGYLQAVSLLHVEPLETESGTIEFWLSCVCVDAYASSISPTILSLEVPAVTTSSTESDIHTAQPTRSDNSAAFIGITTTLVVCLSMMIM
ncbi:hypothetical protein PROFUN_14636 [Planoprotostelium fungivorum]|uniref:Uncharacterized protein n=1 Tax=Planoprotostelium fungivorum TaxID=1890364 RepID=A0A2P6MZC0_9EUKA|nr:hypothetical protein PROFUN_14636 [Planoprotostelium fungivorum]